MKYQKKYKLQMTILFVIGFLFYGKSIAGKTGLQVHSDIPVFHTGDVSNRGPYSGLSDKDRKIIKDKIKVILAKEKYLEKELNKEFYLLKNQMARHRFNTHAVESLSKHVYILEMEFYRNLLILWDKTKANQARISSGFIGRGPVFEQTSFGQAHYKP